MAASVEILTEVVIEDIEIDLFEFLAEYKQYWSARFIIADWQINRSQLTTLKHDEWNTICNTSIRQADWYG